MCKRTYCCCFVGKPGNGSRPCLNKEKCGRLPEIRNVRLPASSRLSLWPLQQASWLVDLTYMMRLHWLKNRLKYMSQNNRFMIERSDWFRQSSFFSTPAQEFLSSLAPLVYTIKPFTLLCGSPTCSSPYFSEPLCHWFTLLFFILHKRLSPCPWHTICLL